MIVLDANILIYAVNADAPSHARAKAWLEAVLSKRETVGFPWNVLLAFLRLSTRPAVFRDPLPLDTAFDVITAWLDQPSAIVVHPGPRHLPILRDLLLRGLWRQSHLGRPSRRHRHRARSRTLLSGQRLCPVRRPEVAQPACIGRQG